MPEKIKFELNEATLKCLTLCPYISEKAIGSIGCGKCDYHYFQKYDGTNRGQKKEGEDFYVECTFKELQNETKRV